MKRPGGDQILEFLIGRRDEFVGFLEQLTLAESPSVVPETQDKVRNIIADRLGGLGFRTLKLSGQHNGGNLFARPGNGVTDRPAQLLLGHYDTVWPLGTLNEMPFIVDGNIVRGPGVYDMKGGITQIIFALEAISHFDLQPGVVPIVFAAVYVTGLRREQNVTRSEVHKVEMDESRGDIVKVNPLVDWTHDDVWKYVRANEIPVNRLHFNGYPSVGCAPCTRAIKPGEDPRAGRWWWENPETKECGLHVDQESEGSGI